MQSSGTVFRIRSVRAFKQDLQFPCGGCPASLQEITQNYREASLSNVARAYGVSLAYVSECVRAQTGKTYKELLQRHRMETAARLLRRSDLNIQQIIAQVGYENTSYFYRLFHERYGLSPREYRQVRAVRSRTTA